MSKVVQSDNNKQKEKDNKNKEKDNKNKEKEKQKDKEDDKSKQVKKDKYAGIEKGDLPNKATAYAKLVFNVKNSQTWLKNHLKRHKIVRKQKDGKDNDDDGKVKIFNAHFALTATDQVICLSLVNLASNKATKAAAGMYEITEEQMMDNINLDRDFTFTFGKYLVHYDSHENYTSQLNILRSTVNKFIETYAFNGGNSNVSLTDEAFNLLMFIMLKNRIMLTETAFQMSQYAGKSSVDDRAILHSIKCHYTGNLYRAVYKKAEEVSRIVRGLKKEKEEDDDLNKSAKKPSNDNDNDKDKDKDKEKEKEKEKNKENNKQDVKGKNKQSSSDSSSSDNDTENNKSGSDTDGSDSD
jgi:hypothetical protein